MPHNKPDTLNREYVTPFSSVMHYAYEQGWRGDPLIRRFQEEEDERPAVTPTEVDLLVANADATSTYKKGAHALRDKNAAYKVALLEYLRLRGTRITDTLNIHRGNDLDLPGARVKLTIGKSRNKVKWLELSPRLVALFANLHPCDDGYLFPWRSRSSVYKWWKPLTERLGIKATPHQFRHALGEEAMDAEIDLITLQNLGGWASLNSVRPYARPSRKRLQAADEARAATAGATKPREMVDGDLWAPEPEVSAPIDNVVKLRA